jgi:hypothetical protein
MRMRAFAVVAMLFGALALGACSGDSAGSGASALIATWDARTINGDALPFTEIDAFEDIVCTTTITALSVTFRANGSYALAEAGSEQCTDEPPNDFSYTDQGPYSVQGNTINFDNGGGFATYSIVAGRLTLSLAGGALVIVFDRRQP